MLSHTRRGLTHARIGLVVELRVGRRIVESRVLEAVSVGGDMAGGLVDDGGGEAEGKGRGEEDPRHRPTGPHLCCLLKEPWREVVSDGYLCRFRRCRN